MYMMSEEEKIREQMEAREEYLIREEARHFQMEKYKKDLKQAKGDLKQTKVDLKQTKGDLHRANMELQNKDRIIAEMQKEIDNLKKIAGTDAT